MTIGRAKPPASPPQPQPEEGDQRRSDPATVGSTAAGPARSSAADFDAAGGSSQNADAEECTESERERYLDRALHHLRGRVGEQQLEEIRRQLRDRWNSDPTLIALIERWRAARGPQH